ncbi:MAG: hypothetical protein KDB97_04645 [Flavobacteriales bacterium]|nr:hypothetical protein [Flavobacteriales bacterium]
MKTLLTSVLLTGHLALNAQFQEQDFDGTQSYPLPYMIDTTAGNIWQVGMPQKPLFNAARSAPNAIVTDTLAAYPPTNTSSFIVKSDLAGYWGWSVFFLRFYHAFDTDTLQEGGYVEVSWDNGASWTNIFSDWMMPLNIENYYADDWTPIIADTLSNGQIGYSGRSGSLTGGLRWVYSSFCWETIGYPLADSVFVRFSFFSDSIPEARDGWMIDNITVEAYIAHPVSAFTRMDDFIVVAPNPVQDQLNIVYDVDQDRTPVHLELIDPAGRAVRVLADGEFPPGDRHIQLDRRELPRPAGPLLLAGHIGGRSVAHRIILAPVSVVDH